MTHTPTSRVHCPGCGCLSPLFVIGRRSRDLESWQQRHEDGNHECDGCDYCREDPR